MCPAPLVPLNPPHPTGPCTGALVAAHLVCARVFKPLFVCTCPHSCISCLAGYYCLPGAVNASGQCPPNAPGADCSDGTLRVTVGYYWVPVTAQGPFVTALTTQRCPNPYACPGGAVWGGNTTAECAIGYTGPLCEVCSGGYVSVAEFCLECRLPGLSSVGVAVVPVLAVATVAFVIALVLEEAMGVKQVWRGG